MKQKEVFNNKENSEYLDELMSLYENDERLFKDSPLPRMAMKLFLDKEKDFEFKVTRPFIKEEGQTKYPNKYLAEFIWDKKETINGDTFCKAFLIIPEAKENKIIISASEDIEIEKEKFNDKDFIRENLLKAFENPIQRLISPFYEAEDLFLLDNNTKK
jgi:hypothetical protein